MMSASGTSPKLRESLLLGRLSPSTNRCPGETTRGDMSLVDNAAIEHLRELGARRFPRLSRWLSLLDQRQMRAQAAEPDPQL